MYTQNCDFWQCSLLHYATCRACPCRALQIVFASFCASSFHRGNELLFERGLRGRVIRLAPIHWRPLQSAVFVNQKIVCRCVDCVYPENAARQKLNLEHCLSLLFALRSCKNHQACNTAAYIFCNRSIRPKGVPQGIHSICIAPPPQRRRLARGLYLP